MSVLLETKDIQASEDVKDTVDQLLPHTSEIIPLSWGKILKGSDLTATFTDDAERLQSLLGLDGMNYSIAIGVMEKSAHHPPYIRVVDNEPRGRRVYSILAGSMTCYRDNELRTYKYSPEDQHIVVGTFDIFSFTAGEEGCVFVIYDFPAFGSPEAIDFNNVVVPV